MDERTGHHNGNLIIFSHIYARYVGVGEKYGKPANVQS